MGKRWWHDPDQPWWGQPLVFPIVAVPMILLIVVVKLLALPLVMLGIVKGRR